MRLKCKKNTRAPKMSRCVFCEAAKCLAGNFCKWGFLNYAANYFCHLRIVLHVSLRRLFTEDTSRHASAKISKMMMKKTKNASVNSWISTVTAPIKMSVDQQSPTNSDQSTVTN